MKGGHNHEVSIWIVFCSGNKIWHKEPFIFPLSFYRWQNTSLQMTTSLDTSTVDFLLGFARLCYHLVRTSSIKMTAILSGKDGSPNVGAHGKSNPRNKEELGESNQAVQSK